MEILCHPHTHMLRLEPARRLLGYAWGTRLLAALRVGTGAEERLAAGNLDAGRVGRWVCRPGGRAGRVGGRDGGQGGV